MAIVYGDIVGLYDILDKILSHIQVVISVAMHIPMMPRDWAGTDKTLTYCLRTSMYCLMS